MLRASGPDVGRMLIGTASKSALRPILGLSRLESGRSSARKPDARPGSDIAYHNVISCGGMQTKKGPPDQARNKSQMPRCSNPAKNLTLLSLYKLMTIKICILFFASFDPVSDRTWPRDPFQRVGLERRCGTHPKLAPDTKYKAGSTNFWSGTTTDK